MAERERERPTAERERERERENNSELRFICIGRLTVAKQS